jgi:hypothetical protein
MKIFNNVKVYTGPIIAVAIVIAIITNKCVFAQLVDGISDNNAFGYCLICPEGNKPSGTGSIIGFQCQELDELGRNSLLTFRQCTDAQIRANQPDDVCGCVIPTICKYTSCVCLWPCVWCFALLLI